MRITDVFTNVLGLYCTSTLFTGVLASDSDKAAETGVNPKEAAESVIELGEKLENNETEKTKSEAEKPKENEAKEALAKDN